MKIEDSSKVLVRLFFEGGFDDDEDAEVLMRGYRSHVWAELADGSRHPVTFYDMARLQQTLDDECASGRPFFTEPGLIVLPEVSLAIMEAAVRILAAEGFFAKGAHESRGQGS